MSKYTQRVKLEQRRKSWKNSGLVVALAAAVVGGAILYNYSGRREPVPVAHTKISLETARTNPSVRQAYLDNLLANTKIPHCSGVSYDHDGTKIIGYLESEIRKVGETNTESYITEYKKTFLGGQYDAQTPELLENSDKGESSPVYVGRKFFERDSYLNDADLRNVLVAHEGRHVLRHAIGFDFAKAKETAAAIRSGKIRKELFYEICEMDAMASKLASALSQPGHTDKYILELKRRFVKESFLLAKISERAPEAERSLIVCELQNVAEERQLRDISLVR